MGFEKTKSKSNDQREYDRLNKLTKQMCAKAKEIWLEKQCAVIEQDSKSYVRSICIKTCKN